MHPNTVTTTPSATRLSRALNRRISTGLTTTQSALLTRKVVGRPVVACITVLAPRGIIPGTPQDCTQNIINTIISNSHLIIQTDFQRLDDRLHGCRASPISPPGPGVASTFRVRQNDPARGKPFRCTLRIVLGRAKVNNSTQKRFALATRRLRTLGGKVLCISLRAAQCQNNRLQNVLVPD